jgi:hypothetical protein
VSGSPDTTMPSLYAGKRVQRRNRSGWALPSMAFWTLNASERRRLFAALIVAVVLSNIGVWILRGQKNEEGGMRMLSLHVVFERKHRVNIDRDI